jgi:hypothetical protein
MGYVAGNVCLNLSMPDICLNLEIYVHLPNLEAGNLGADDGFGLCFANSS